MLKKLLLFAVFLVSVAISASYSQTAIKVNAKASHKAKPEISGRFNSSGHIENNQQKIKTKPKVKIVVSDSSPGFAAYISMPKEKRAKMLREGD